MNTKQIFHLPAEASVRLLLVTDSHAGAGFGTFSTYRPDGSLLRKVDPWERIRIMTECIEEERRFQKYDALICLGDMVSSEHNCLDKTENDVAYLADKYTDTNYNVREKFISEILKGWKGYFVSDTRKHLFYERFLKEYMSALSLPAFYIYANHDDLFDDEWRRLLGYEKNYILHFGNTLTCICVDSYHGQPDDPSSRIWGYGQKMTDISEEFYQLASEELKGKQNAIVLTHFAEDENTPLLSKLIAENDCILGTLCGHTHTISVETLGGKPRIESGNFSLGNPAHEKELTEETVCENAGCWGFRVLEVSSEQNSAETYMVYPDVNYGVTPYHQAFHQARFSTKNTKHKGYVVLK